MLNVCRQSISFFAFFSVCLCSFPLHAQLSPAQLEDIEFTALQNLLGGSMPTGAGVSLTQVEALDTGSYRPDSSVFVSKAFSFPSVGSASISSHATTVGQFLYGASGIAPDMGSSATSASIAVYDAADWLGSGFLHTGTASLLPNVDTRPIQNHSWIGSTSNAPLDTEILRRFDYMLARDNVFATVGVNNGSANPLPALLGQSHNALAVGLSNGDHSAGSTTLDGSGRTKPDIVVPTTATSWATATVAGAGALLLQTASTNASLSNASESVVLRSLLLAGASKEEPEFAIPWTHSESTPLDTRYGAGELDLQTSFDILSGGEFGSSAGSLAAQRGWDFGSTSVAAPGVYFFDLTSDAGPLSLTASLVWNSVVVATDTNSDHFVTAYGFSTIIPNLDLRLYSATGFALESQIAASLSTVDNLELIYAKDLSPGRYALSVSSGTDSVNYGLAWTASVPEPSSLLLLSGAVIFLLRFRNSRQRV
jgi:hypothetical protein